VDSEELVGEDGAAINAFDGDPATKWHTQWAGINPDPSVPHEIQINLGSVYDISGFRYLPRQDGINGRIGQYAFYVSTDGTDWGSPVATGTFSNDDLEQENNFLPVLGQFIRLEALSEANGGPWTSAAEINVKGQCDNLYLSLLTPLSFHIQPSDQLSVSASVCINQANYPGWGVKFELDGGVQAGGQEQVVYQFPYEATFDFVSMAEHTIDAYIIDDQGVASSMPNTDDSAFPVGIGDYFVAIGDSISEGQGDDIASDDTSQDGRNSEGGFTPILGDALTGERGYPNFCAMEGIGGFTSVQGLDRLPRVLDAHPLAQFYLILYGTNDAGFLLPIPSGEGLSQGDPSYPGTFKDNIQQMIDLILNAGKEPYLAKIPFALNASSSRSNAIQAYNRVIDELVSENSITIVPPDFYTFFLNNQNMMSDNFHPDGVGYQNMAQMWADALR
jgi:lysophospholipase L1-like esterase